ncbi:MAG: ABC transporter permease [Anaerolineales bacterium]|nr:ABC transporter permease [Anaerolineales bacterium]
MNLSLVLRRVRRLPRQLAALTLAVCLVTGFFALAPLYVRVMVQAGLLHEFESFPVADRALTLISPTPYAPAAWDTLNASIADLNDGLIRVSRSGSPFGGFALNYGEPTTELSGRSEFRHYAFAFSDMATRFRLLDGRFPQRLAPPDDPARQALTSEDQIAKGVGIYSLGEVEAVITPLVAERSRYEIGTRFVIGERPGDHVVVHVVGIVEAVDLTDPLWDSNRAALEGEIIETGLTTRAYNMAFIVTEGAYTDWVARATRTNNRDNNSFLWRVALNVNAINADNIADTQENLRNVIAKIGAEYPGLLSFAPILKLLDAYRESVSRAELPVILLAGAVLVMMLYHLVATVSLFLEQQREEWASLSSRGAGVGQLMSLQGLTMAILCLIGFILGPLVALLILQFLLVASPLFAATGGVAPISGIPRSAVILSGIAAVASLVMLTLPALSAARRSLAEFKQIAARPPDRPLWARYGLDIIFILVGLGFIARLLFFIEGDLGGTLALLFSNPGALIRLLLDSATRTGGLGDPFNLVGPALFLTGIALLWLRLFPLVVRLVGAPFRRSNGLTSPLSVWTVERDPGHYGQLVLLLIGTLALGTAALALNATRDGGTWAQARQDTGGTVRIDLDLANGGRMDAANWAALPDVRAATTLTRYNSAPLGGEEQFSFVGITPAQIADIFPEYASILHPLTTVIPTTFQEFDRQLGKSVSKTIYPAILSEKMAMEAGRQFRDDRLPLMMGSFGSVGVLLPDNTRHTVIYLVVGIVRDFPTLGANDQFLIMNEGYLMQAFNANISVPLAYRAVPNQIWLDLTTRVSTPALVNALNTLKGVKVTWASDRYEALLREPLPAAAAGMLFAGFWVSLALSLLDFGFYLAVTARRRSLGFAVLRALGWNANRIWAQLITEHTVLVLPALIVGILLGGALAYVIVPFLRLVGGATLVLPLPALLMLMVVMILSFAVLTFGAAWWLRRLNINQVLRLGEE